MWVITTIVIALVAAIVWLVGCIVGIKMAVGYAYESISREVLEIAEKYNVPDECVVELLQKIGITLKQ